MHVEVAPIQMLLSNLVVVAFTALCLGTDVRLAVGVCRLSKLHNQEQKRCSNSSDLIEARYVHRLSSGCVSELLGGMLAALRFNTLPRKLLQIGGLRLFICACSASIQLAEFWLAAVYVSAMLALRE